MKSFLMTGLRALGAFWWTVPLTTDRKIIVTPDVGEAPASTSGVTTIKEDRRLFAGGEDEAREVGEGTDPGQREERAPALITGEHAELGSL